MASVPSIPPVILRRKKLEARIGQSRSAIYAKLDKNSPYYDPTFPRPISLGVRAVGWVESEVDKWLVAQIDKSRKVAA